MHSTSVSEGRGLAISAKHIREDANTQSTQPARDALAWPFSRAQASEALESKALVPH